MEYNTLKDIMSYFYFEFNINYVLGAIMLVNTIKIIKDYTSIRKSNSEIFHNIKSSYYDLIISSFVMIGLYNGVMFQGVIADISSEYSQLWITKMMIVGIVSFVLFIIQLIFFMMLKKYKRDVTNLEK
ncbi:hypothetical protein [Clostridium senegalense]|uniref:Uncharacterized protein n=1 Tax=Clostridium senegalense TaxID=1465809 RepID=A0A6M0H6S7_9CLOT|nr:hypothetical protein [Clostridium senegalense]NEU05703.1 hypothetical protein [Clostridium senegalense]